MNNSNGLWKVADAVIYMWYSLYLGVCGHSCGHYCVSHEDNNKILFLPKNRPMLLNIIHYSSRDWKGAYWKVAANIWHLRWPLPVLGQPVSDTISDCVGSGKVARLEDMGKAPSWPLMRLGTLGVRGWTGQVKLWSYRSPYSVCNSCPWYPTGSDLWYSAPMGAWFSTSVFS